MKKLIAIALLVSCGGQTDLAGFRTERLGRPDNIQREEERSYYIQTQCVDGKTQSGSATIVNGEVVTAAHVVRCPGVYAIKYEGDIVFLLRRKLDVGNDIAVLTPDRPIFAPKVRFGIGEKGDRICLEQRSPITKRVCGKITFSYEGRIHFDAPVYPGASGSGVYNMLGELVGVVSMGVIMRNGQSLGGTANAIQ